MLGSAGNVSFLWSVSSGECVHELRGHAGVVKVAVFSADGAFVLSASVDNTARLWAVASGECVCTFEDESHPIKWASMSNDGTLVVTTSGCNAQLWDAKSGARSHAFAGHEKDGLLSAGPLIRSHFSSESAWGFRHGAARTSA